MYYIYHIPNVKIGCTNNPKRRVKDQGYRDYNILETHNDIDVASKRELELQKEYGYKIDKNSYKNAKYQRSILNPKIAHLGGHKTKGEKNGQSKLTEQDVDYIRKNYKAYCLVNGGKALCKKYNICVQTLHNILNRKSWTHI